MTFSKYHWNWTKLLIYSVAIQDLSLIPLEVLFECFEWKIVLTLSFAVLQQYVPIYYVEELIHLTDIHALWTKTALSTMDIQHSEYLHNYTRTYCFNTCWIQTLWLIPWVGRKWCLTLVNEEEPDESVIPNRVVFVTISMIWLLEDGSISVVAHCFTRDVNIRKNVNLNASKSWLMMLVLVCVLLAIKTNYQMK